MASSRLPWPAVLPLALSIFLAALVLQDLLDPRRELKAEPTREAQLAQELEDLFSRVAEEVKLSVVAIETTEGPDAAPGDGNGGNGNGNGNDNGNGQAPQAERESIGSGFVIDSRGYVLTNHHLVGGAAKIWVRFHDGRELRARAIQSDATSDLALLKVETEGLRPASMGDSDGVRVGQWVLAIGNPFGLTQTVSAGIVSALKRSDLRILPFESFIQTDASINPGNSGGPLVNLRGEVIGINTAMYTNPGGGNQGIGFAIPVELAKTLVKRWMEGKSASYLGVVPARVDQDMARYFALVEPRGAFLTRVDPSGPGAAAGLGAKDVVLAFGGVEVKDENHLRVLIAGASPDEPVEIEILRQHRRETIRVVPREKEAPSRTAEPPPDAGEGAEAAPKTRLLGITVTPVSPRIAEQLGIRPISAGMAVLDVQQGSPAQKKGLHTADVIVEVNERRVTSLDELKAALEASEDVALLRVERGNGEPGYLFLPR